MPQIQKRFLNVHEFLSQELMGKFGIRVPKGSVARTPEEAQRVAERLGSFFFRLLTQEISSFLALHGPFF
jgi:acyl-CoA synthetase (NDP forming)